jgi:hypothetical protein
MSSLFLLLYAVAAATDPVSFPGPAGAPDPTNRYSVTCGAAQGGQYPLKLRAASSGQERALLSFRLSATVLWAPDGKAVAITQRDSRDASTVRVFFPEKPGDSADMGAELTKSFGRMPEREDNGHVYIEAVRWMNAKTLRFRLRGYGNRDREGFDELFDYPFGGRVERAKSIIAGVVADAMATKTPVPAPTVAPAVLAHELPKAEYAVRWNPVNGGPKDAREVLSLLGQKAEDVDTYEIEYFDLPPVASAPAGATTILRRRHKANGKTEIRLKYRLDRPLEENFSCPAGLSFEKSEEEDLGYPGSGAPVRVYSYSCSLDAAEPPASLSAVAKPCSSKMVRYKTDDLKVEEWTLPDATVRVELSRSAKNTAAEAATFEALVQRLIERGVHPSDGSKTDIASQCPVAAVGAPTPAPASSPASHEGNPFRVAGVDDPARVREFLAALKAAVAKDDAEAVARLTSFPLDVAVGGRRESVSSAARFMQLYKDAFTPCLRRLVETASVDELFANANGIMFGSGAIWFSPLEGGAIRIITINGPMAKEKLCGAAR